MGDGGSNDMGNPTQECSHVPSMTITTCLQERLVDLPCRRRSRRVSIKNRGFSGTNEKNRVSPVYPIKTTEH